jgi:copper transport protein
LLSHLYISFRLRQIGKRRVRRSTPSRPIGHSNWTRKLYATFGLALLAFLLLPLLAQAHPQLPFHAQYDRSDPPANAKLPGGHPPTRVQVWFTEQIDPNFSKLTVFNQQRQQVDLGDSHGAPNDPSSLIISLPPSLPDGAYTVVYQTLSAEDGHRVTNAFSFVVGGAPLPTDTNAFLSSLQTSNQNLNTWSVGIRWLNYLGLTGLVGGLTFLLVVWRPSRTRLKAHIGDVLDHVCIQIESRAQWFFLACLLTLLLGWISFLSYQASSASASPVWQIIQNGALMTLLLQSRFGTLWLIRLGFLVGACILWLLLYHNKRKKGSQKTLPWLILLAGIGVMCTNSLISHAAAHRAAWILVPADLLHLASTSIWIGGLFCLVLVLPVALQLLVPGKGDRTHFFAAIIPRFTVVAMISVAILAATGIVQTLFLLNVLSAFSNGDYGEVFSATLGSEYGRALTIKSAVFLVLIGFGAFNAFRISPRMQQFAARTGNEDGAGSFAAGRLQYTFRRVVTTEASIMLSLLVVIGGLTSLSPHPPPRTSTTNGPLLREGQIADLTYHLAINPGKVGLNTFQVALIEQGGQSARHVDKVLAYFIMEDMQMGVEVLNFTPIQNTPGTYEATASILSMSGRWAIDLIVRRTGFEDAKVTIHFTV